MTDDPTPSDPRGAGVTAVAQVAISVTDIPRAVAFYGDVLGLPLLFDLPEQKIAFLQAGGVRLYLDANEMEGYHSSPLVYWTVADLDVAEAAVRAAGIEIESAPHIVHRTDAMELWMFLVRDPDGNAVGLMQEKPL
jgi:catechol 2,3-dioxygenase-like lactoylglutathione lyase family enzyme